MSTSSENLKRNQIPNVLVTNWLENLENELEATLDLIIPPFYLEKSTFEILSKNNENRIRVYLGLEEEEQEGKKVMCSFAVSTFSLGDGSNVYEDYATPIYKLTSPNQDYSGNIAEAKACMDRWNEWREGIGYEPTNPVLSRQYIYPISYLMNKYELYYIFDVQDESVGLINFGIQQLLKLMIQAEPAEAGDGDPIVFDFSYGCPPNCP